jgi:hypothetical protein
MIKSNLYKNTILNDGPSRYWLLNESSGSTFSDIVGRNNGTEQGTLTYGGAGLLPNNNNENSINFGNNAGRIEFNNTIFTPNTSYSVDAWITHVSATNVIINQSDSGGAYIVVATLAAGSVLYLFAGSSGAVQTPTSLLTAGQTYHICATREFTDTGGPGGDEVVSIYIDGSLITSVSQSTSFDDYSTLSSLASVDVVNQSKTSMGHVAIYPYILTGDQVKAHFDAGNLTDPLISSFSNSLGSNRIQSLISSNMSNNVDIPYVAYINSGKIISGKRDNPLMLGGIPLSTSLYVDDTTNGYFYALDVIEDTSASFHIDHLRYESFQLDQGKYLSTKKADGKLYWTILPSSREPTVSKELVWNGVSMGISVNDEFIMNNTGFGRGHITQYKEVMIGGIPLTVGRRQDKYYLVVSPATIYDIA